jgi:hypothetical protein
MLVEYFEILLPDAKTIQLNVDGVTKVCKFGQGIGGNPRKHAATLSIKTINILTLSINNNINK